MVAVTRRQFGLLASLVAPAYLRAQTPPKVVVLGVDPGGVLHRQGCGRGAGRHPH
ncbi:hypothetical protein [Breoghania sp.]|uniref:hypothetical protein n=1 Tax=Breoghania sp. TaxID=2065378 RepID=UPI003204A6CA